MRAVVTDESPAAFPVAAGAAGGGRTGHRRSRDHRRAPEGSAGVPGGAGAGVAAGERRGRVPPRHRPRAGAAHVLGRGRARRFLPPARGRHAPRGPAAAPARDRAWVPRLGIVRAGRRARRSVRADARARCRLRRGAGGEARARRRGGGRLAARRGDAQPGRQHVRALRERQTARACQRPGLARRGRRRRVRAHAAAPTPLHVPAPP